MGGIGLRVAGVVVALLFLIVVGFRHEQTLRFYFFFGVCGIIAGVLVTRWIRESIENKTATTVVASLTLIVVFGVSFLFLEYSCFLSSTKDEYRDSPEVFFPILLDLEVSDSVDTAGSRVALLNEYGPSEIRRVLEKMAFYGFRSNLTLLLLGILLSGVMSAIPILLLYLELQTVNNDIERTSKNDQSIPMKQLVSAPTLFISYSHDSEPHKQRVLELAQQLRADGIDVSLDRFVQSPAEGWPLWMLRQIDWADYVLCIFTERYNERCLGNQKPGEGKGVAWESTLMFNALYGSPQFNTKFIPIVFDRQDEKWIIQPMKGFSYFHLDNLDANVSGGYQNVYRLVTNQPEVTPAGVGAIHKLPPAKPLPIVQQTSVPTPVSPKSPTVPIIGESELRKRLGELLPSMFDSIVADMEADGYVSGQNAPTVSRAIELVKFAKIRGELNMLIGLYLEIINPK